jgi:hypothetical protein
MDHPQIVVQVGNAGEQGVVEISDVIFATRGPAGGAIVVEWNVREGKGTRGSVGMWDSHIRYVLGNFVYIAADGRESRLGGGESYVLRTDQKFQTHDDHRSCGYEP